jgi:hypothetical protein
VRPGCTVTLVRPRTRWSPRGHPTYIEVLSQLIASTQASRLKKHPVFKLGSQLHEDVQNKILKFQLPSHLTTAALMFSTVRWLVGLKFHGEVPWCPTGKTRNPVTWREDGKAEMGAQRKELHYWWKELSRITE